MSKKLSGLAHIEKYLIIIFLLCSCLQSNKKNKLASEPIEQEKLEKIGEIKELLADLEKNAAEDGSQDSKDLKELASLAGDLQPEDILPALESALPIAISDELDQEDLGSSVIEKDKRITAASIFLLVLSSVKLYKTFAPSQFPKIKLSRKYSKTLNGLLTSLIVLQVGWLTYELIEGSSDKQNIENLVLGSGVSLSLLGLSSIGMALYHKRSVQNNLKDVEKFYEYKLTMDGFINFDEMEHSIKNARNKGKADDEYILTKLWNNLLEVEQQKYRLYENQKNKWNEYENNLEQKKDLNSKIPKYQNDINKLSISRENKIRKLFDSYQKIPISKRNNTEYTLDEVLNDNDKYKKFKKQILLYYHPDKNLSVDQIEIKQINSIRSELSDIERDLKEARSYIDDYQNKLSEIKIEKPNFTKPVNYYKHSSIPTSLQPKRIPNLNYGRKLIYGSVFTAIGSGIIAGSQYGFNLNTNQPTNRAYEILVKLDKIIRAF